MKLVRSGRENVAKNCESIGLVTTKSKFPRRISDSRALRLFANIFTNPTNSKEDTMSSTSFRLHPLNEAVCAKNTSIRAIQVMDHPNPRNILSVKSDRYAKR